MLVNSIEGNPQRNRLPPGVGDAHLEAAVRASGYPLQQRVVAKLGDDYWTQEEWAYVDWTTRTQRTLDLLIQRPFWSDDPNRFRVRPTLVLLIECKQSELPFVFFLQTRQGYSPPPTFAGLKSLSVVVTTDDDRSRWHVEPAEALGLREHRFLLEPPRSASLTKAVRKGSEIQMSGDQAYNSLILPLMSAASHFVRTAHPVETAFYFELSMVVRLAVVDAPMVAVRVTPQGEEFELRPWVRLLRHEPAEPQQQRRNETVAWIDVVHADFLTEYLERHVVPFMEELAVAAHRHHEELATGKGFARGMGADSWSNLERRLRPRTFSLDMPESIPRRGLSEDVGEWIRMGGEWIRGRYRIWRATGRR